MNSIIPAPIAALPWRLIFILTGLTIFGAVVLYSAAGGSFQPWAGKHLIRFFVLLIMALIIGYLPLDFWKTITFPAYGITLILLLIVEIIGHVGGGSQRWINLGIITLQPSELMKPVLVLASAWFFDRVPATLLGSPKVLMPLAALLIPPCILVIIQPDFDAAIVFIFIVAMVCFLAGWPIKYFIGAGAAIGILAPLVFFFGLKPYQQDRVLIFFNPESDPLGKGYHITQSKIAIGSGGIFGKGFGNGTQSHLDYLPEGHTDFVFATMAEEWGLMGGLIILGLFYLLMRWCIEVAMKCRSRYGKLLAMGMTCTIFFFVAINLLMVMGLFPVAGIPLPFISHGGSSMMTIMICIGVILSVSRHPDRQRYS
jgi:rod shape determining protein RodA